MIPIVGDAFKEDLDEDAPVLPPPMKVESSLCENCFHGYVCVVAQQIRQITPPGTSIAVGQCSYFMPMVDNEEETEPDSAEPTTS